MTSRREFLGVAAGTLATGGLPIAARAQEKTTAESRPPKSTDPCGLVRLTDKIQCSRIGFGTGMRGGRRLSNLVRSGQEAAMDLLRFAYDQGVRTFDVADTYGSHPFVADALEGKPRDSYTLISKIWVLPGALPEPERPDADVVIERFLKELKTDYIDLVQLHCMTKADWPTTWAKQMDLLEKAKEQGKIRAHGMSAHSVIAMETAAGCKWTDAVHVRINSEGLRMDGDPKKEAAAETVARTVAATEKLHEAGIGTIAMKIVGEGQFRDDPELRKKSTAFVTGLDCIDVLVVGFEKKEEIAECIANVAEALKAQAVRA